MSSFSVGQTENHLVLFLMKLARDFQFLAPYLVYEFEDACLEVLQIS